jgi:hypothetical protein
MIRELKHIKLYNKNSLHRSDFPMLGFSHVGIFRPYSNKDFNSKKELNSKKD